MKKILLRFCLILALVLSLALSVMAGEPVLTASQEECLAGESVTVTVSFANNPGVWGMDVKVGYDASVMTLTAVTNGTVFDDTEQTEGNMAGNPYILSYERAGFDNTTVGGVLATMTFAVRSDAAPGTYPITVNCTKGNAINADEEDVELQTVNGSVAVKETTPQALPYSIESLKACDKSGHPLTAMPNSDFLASTIIRRLGTDENATVLLAAYTADGQMRTYVCIRFRDVPLSSAVEAMLPIVNDGSISFVKAFVLSSAENAIPLAQTVELR